LERAKKKYEDSLARERDVLKARLQVLEEITLMTRKQAEVLAQTLAKETAAESKTTIAQPQS
jgi:hypothetical protein